MTILKKSSRFKRKRKTIFLGVQLPKDMSSYLSLYCLSTGESKSLIVKTLLSDWIKKEKIRYSEEILINKIALRAFEVWKNPEGRRPPFIVFKSELKRELERMKVSETIINKIIDILDNEKGKEEKSE